MSSLQFFIDASSRHAVFLQRYSEFVARFAGRRIDSILREAANSVEKGEAVDLIKSYSNLELALRDFLREFTNSEIEFYAEMLRTGTKLDDIQLPVPLVVMNHIEANFMEVAPGRGITISAALQQFNAKKVNQVEQAIRDGFTSGKTQQQVAQAVLALIPLQKNQAASLIKTANTSMSTIAAFESFRANADILEGYKWVSTLDSRTTFICMARDGNRYPLSIQSPTPPAHWGCRSVIIPVVNRRFDLLGDIGGVRPSETGEVSTRLTYGAWLRKQPRAFVNEALGVERAELFLSGQVSIDSFVDPTGRTYTLDELRNSNQFALDF